MATQMQFDSNDDWPVPSDLMASTVDTPPDQAAPVDPHHRHAWDPLEFPPAEIDSCARITTRIFSPTRNMVSTVPHVLVQTMKPSQNVNSAIGDSTAAAPAAAAPKKPPANDDDLWTSSDDDDDDDDDDDEEMEDAGQASESRQPQADRAYWLQRTLREAIYGRVKYAVVLRRRPKESDGDAEWEVTEEKCAVKEMSWDHIRRERHSLAEDPIKEVSAMQFLKRYHDNNSLERDGLGGGGTRSESLLSTHIMMPMDLLSDDRYLYSVMPFCDGGELFDRLDERSKFSEEESRYWMYQILDGVENLQRAGVCHRDMSLENLLVHRARKCLIIDMGMCLRVPYTTDAAAMDTGTGTAATGNVSGNNDENDFSDWRRRAGRRRGLILPQGTCGKWHYMSPEIMRNVDPFDGHAVDMWAIGVILFLMLTGFPPWERPCRSDERFRYMTAGYLVQMLTEWQLGLSPDAMDLLQRMLWIDPRDRLSLAQVRAHPWMTNGPREIPHG